MRAYIYQCKDLPSADNDGCADPFVELWSNLTERTLTPVVEDNCNPMFFSCIQTYMDFDTPETAPPIVLNIWDKDIGIIDSEDFMGRAVISIKDASKSDNDTIPTPKWHKVRMGFNDDEPSFGEILVSFSITSDQFEFK